MMRVNRKIRRLFGLEAEVRRSFIVSISIAPVVRLLVKTLGYRRTLNIVNRYCTLSPPAQPNSSNEPCEVLPAPRNAWNIVEGFDLACRYMPSRGDCLSRSIILFSLLRAHNHLAKLKVGVQPERNEIAAHAWVELNGIALSADGKLGKGFTPLGAVAV